MSTPKKSEKHEKPVKLNGKATVASPRDKAHQPDKVTRRTPGEDLVRIRDRAAKNGIAITLPKTNSAYKPPSRAKTKGKPLSEIIVESRRGK